MIVLPHRDVASLRRRPPRAGWGSGARVFLAVGLGVLGVALASGTAKAAGIGGGGTPSFSAQPVPTKAGARSYFSFSAAPGARVGDAIVVHNDAAEAATFKLSAARGITAVGSGDGFSGQFAPCSGTACWLSGLPASITVPASSARRVGFVVTVPPQASPQQYLAGVVVAPAATPAPTVIGRRGKTTVSAVILRQVDIGVAVTVGSPASLRTSATVTGLRGKVFATLSRVELGIRNTGQTFAHVEGSMTCSGGGKAETAPVGSSTILPATSTELTINTPGLVTGVALHCVVHLQVLANDAVGSVATLAQYSGVVTLPKPSAVTIVPTGPGQYVAIPKHHPTPRWVYGLYGLGALVVLLLAALLVSSRRHKGAQARLLAEAVAAASAPAEQPAGTGAQD